MSRLFKKTKPFLAYILTLSLLVGLPQLAAFAEAAVLAPPQRYQVSDIGYVQNLNKKDWYADLKWDPVTFPADSSEKYITVSLNEVERGTGRIIQDAIQIPLPGNATSQHITEYSPDTLKNGTIYESYARASYKVITQSSQYTVQSQKSNPVKFLTGMHVSVELIPGTNNIKIKWDDVWDSNGRISYRILISDTKGFTQPPPVPDIVASEIGKADSPVVVNNSEKKLEFTYTYALPGREYAIKVVPLPDRVVACATAEEIEAVSIKTDILLKASKVGYTNNGDTIWKLFWNPIVKGSSFTRVDYELYRYTNNETTGQLFRLIPEQDSYQITIAKDDPNAYSFKIDAKAYTLSSPAPVEFRSNSKVALKEQVPQQPMAPELVDAFPMADPDPLVFDDLLTSTNATVMWKAPYTGEGLVDTDITYDVYMVEDIKNVSNPPSNFKIASDLTMSPSNEIRDKLSGKIIGYKFDLVGLRSNSTYYFVIYAKKSFLVESPTDGFMITMPYISKQTVKVIITRPDTGTDRPIAPASPPFVLKPDPGSVTYTKATVLLDKRWYAFYDDVAGKWVYATQTAYQDNLLLPDGDPLKKESMIVNYMPGWTVVPRVVSYNDALNAIKLRNNRTDEYIAYSDLTQPDILAFEIPQQAVAVPEIPEDQDQTFEIDLEGLTHNTSYIVWLVVQNQNGNSSDPSDPIIITTPPDIPVVPVTPTVPNDLKGIAADDFVDLFWTFKKDMEYEIVCGTTDDRESATITGSITYQELLKTTFYRLEGLEANTLYYVWIRTVSTAPDGSKLMSEYSNPLIIKTEAYKPPAPPSGFGVKTGTAGVTEKSISYVWQTKPNQKYYLEFADNIHFEESTMHEVNGSTYTATGLISNRRYYARLYAYDNKTKLWSVPTSTVMVITNKSKSEYDSSYDLDDVPTGDVLVISPTVQNGIWTVNSTGVNAHRLAEQVRSIRGPIVQIDLSQPPARAQTIRLDLGAVLIDSLSEQKKELLIRLPSSELLIRPDSLHTDDYFKLKNTDSNFSLRLEAVSPASSYKIPAELKLMVPVTELKIGAANAPSFNKLAKPIQIGLPFSNLSTFGAGQIKTYLYDDSSKSWLALSTVTNYLTGKVTGELSKPGAYMAATQGVSSIGTVPAYITASLNSIQSVFTLSALKGKTFNHADNVNQNDIVKLLLDVIPAAYQDWDYLDKAVKSGLIKKISDIQNTSARRDQAIHLLVSLYAYKTRESTVPLNTTAWSPYKDLGKADARYVSSLKFAIENGIVQGNGSNLANPDKMVTYGEFMIMMERVLKLCGEL